MSTVGERRVNEPEEGRKSDELSRRDEHDGTVHGIHWLVYCAMVGAPVGLLTSDSINAPGPEWMWDAIVVATVGVLITVVRVIKRRRSGEDPRDEFREEVENADSRHRGRSSLAGS